jgi:phospholipase/carboxylesterase
VRRLAATLPLALLLALGCTQKTPDIAPSPPAASLSSQRSAETEEELHYVERTTGGASADERLPMIVALHGLGDRPENFARNFDDFRARARLIVPRGLDPYHDGFSWFPISPPRIDLDRVASGTERASRRLASSIASLARQKPTAGRPIVTGVSQGGMLSFALAVLHPEVQGEAYPVAGLLAPLHWPSSWAPGKFAPKLRSFHGEVDPLVPLAVDRQSVDRLASLGIDATLRTYPGVDHTVTAEMWRDLLKALEEAVKRAETR